MSHERFYLDDPLTSHIILDGPEFHHLAHVLRVRVSEEVELVNGRGVLAHARVTTLEKHKADLSIIKREEYERPRQNLLLGLALLRMGKLEWMVEKATELGADALYFFNADHSEKDALSSNQIERLRHLTIAALKQCKRLYLPEFQIYSSLNALLQTDAAILFGDIDPEAPKLSPHLLSHERILFITGPELGFSAKETELLKQKGLGVTLNANILRAETAPLAALSIMSIER